jgi:hypothetical protein
VRTIAAFLVLAASQGGTPVAQAAGPELLEIEGNLVLVDEVYLAFLDLPANAAANVATVVDVERQILGFLRRAGYALARVEATAEGGRIRVKVDEGQLARVVVKGRNIFSSLAIRFQVELPFDVFNKPQLERMLRELQQGSSPVPYALILAREVKDDGFQLDSLYLLPGRGADRAPPPGAYELHIDFSGNKPGAGLSIVAGVDPDSMRVGGELKGYSGIFDDDRWELEVQVGAQYLEDLRRQANELKFSRVFGDARWLAPAFIRGTLRPALRVREDLVRRQRKDLLVESYWWNRLESAVGLGLEPRKGLDLTLEVGLQQRDLFGIVQLDDPATSVSLGSTSDLVWFTALTGRFIFDPERARADRRHRLLFDARQSLGADRKPFWLVDASYRRVFEFGWNELWLRSSISGVAGNYEVADALPMRFLRGVFGSDFYLDRVGAAVVEYRVSLQRDVFKVGVFHEAAVFREAAGPASAGRIGAGNSFGPSFQALVLDVFHLDFSYAFGFLDDGSFDYGTSLNIHKAF